MARFLSPQELLQFKIKRAKMANLLLEDQLSFCSFDIEWQQLDVRPFSSSFFLLLADPWGAWRFCRQPSKPLSTSEGETSKEGKEKPFSLGGEQNTMRRDNTFYASAYRTKRVNKWIFSHTSLGAFSFEYNYF